MRYNKNNCRDAECKRNIKKQNKKQWPGGIEASLSMHRDGRIIVRVGVVTRCVDRWGSVRWDWDWDGEWEWDRD